MSSPTELAIRLRRAEFNRALAAADLDAIGPLLAPDVILVTGSDSAVIAGRKAQLSTWKREFAASARTTNYIRTTESVIASPVEPIALEHGDWRGTAAATGNVLAAGRYVAKWRKIGANWVIEAEVYITLS